MLPLLRLPGRLLASVLIALVRAYQVVLSPFLPPSCRFTPSCSQYAIEALRAHGPLRGSCLTLRRLMRCRPFGPSGFDPVPPSRQGERPLP
ncbi:MAG: membrane protein insertion efficiency factor YidD [Kiritimatiellia bacterium]|jgi:putative membrane protein insertion efficiency factor